MPFGFLKGLADKAGFGDALDKWSKDKDFMEGAMAAAAWVASAGTDEASEKEKEKVKGFIQRSEYLKHFDRLLCLRTYNTYVEEFEFDKGMGADRCRKELNDVTDPDKGLNIARLSVAIAGAEADIADTNPISPAERQVIVEICQALRVDFKALNI